MAIQPPIIFPPLTSPGYPSGQEPILPPWVPPSQNQSPSASDINGVSSTLSNRIVAISPWNQYIPIIFGRDKTAGQISLIFIRGNFLYLRIIWCIGEIESIESVTLSDDTVPDNIEITNYLGTSTQIIDPTLAGVITDYTDNLRDIGSDNYNIAYSSIKVPVASLDSFPNFVAEIKGLKMLSPVPSTKETRLSGLSVSDGDTLSFIGNEITITDNTDGIIGQFIRYNENELINNDVYNFVINVTNISGMGAGNAVVQWCGQPLIDDNTSGQMNINAIGEYRGSSSLANYTAGNNFIRFDISGANTGVSITYNVIIYNATGNAVKAYSDIAGVALNHLITDNQMGIGATSDLQSLVALIDRNSQVLASGSFSESRSSIGLTLAKKEQLSKHIEVLRGYARCVISNEGGVFEYNTLEPKVATLNITAVVPNSLKPVVKDARAIPNIIRVFYTDTFTDPWKDNFIQIETPEVTSGAEYKREAVFKMNGFQTRPAALRFAFDRINERLRTFACTFRTHEDFYMTSEGDTFNLTHPRLGANPHKMKVFSKRKVSSSMWEIYAELEDDAIYSNEIADFDPNSGTITAPNPFTLIDATNLAATVELPRYETGIYLSRLRVTWDVTDYQYNHFYKVELYRVSDGTLFDSKTLPKGTTQAVLNTVQEGILYRIELKIIGFGGGTSTGISMTITPEGKDFPPTDIEFFEGNSLNGTLSLSWSQALDNEEVNYYSIQYGQAGFEWDGNGARGLHARIDALQFSTNIVPAGTYDFLIKAIDNAYNMSANAKRLSSVTIGQAPDKIRLINEKITWSKIGSGAAGIQVLSNNVENWDSTLPLPDTTDWSSGSLTKWSDMFPNPMNTYTDNLLTYGTADTNFILTSQIFAFGGLIDAVFSINLYAESDNNFVNHNLKAGEIAKPLDGLGEVEHDTTYFDGTNWIKTSEDTFRANASMVKIVYDFFTSGRRSLIYKTPVYFTIDAFVQELNVSKLGTHSITFPLGKTSTHFVSASLIASSSAAGVYITIDPPTLFFSTITAKVWRPDGLPNTVPVTLTGTIKFT